MNPEARNNKNDETTTSKWDILTKYDETERARVDRIKEEVRGASWGESPDLERNKIDVPPSTIKKLGRSVLDLINLTIPAVEERREREAMSVAHDKLKKEDDEREANRIMENTQGKIGSEVRRIQAEEYEEARERRALERDMALARDTIEYNKQERFKHDRVQEFVERDLNKKLVTVDKLEEEALSENPEVEKASVEYEGEEIPVYNLKGYPFSMLIHAIDYRHGNDDKHIGVATMNALLEDPSIWAQTEEEAKEADGYGTRNANARGDAISASYINSEKNMNSHVVERDYAHTFYGFSHLGGDSIIGIYGRDGGTSNMAGKIHTTVSTVDAVDSLESSARLSTYNEVLLRRYDETGKPRIPDYIVATEGKITDAMKKQAKYFNIPIISIDKKAYSEKFKQTVDDAVNSISEDSSYEDIASAVDTIMVNRDNYNANFGNIEHVGDGGDVEALKLDRMNKNENVVNAEAIELKKRLEFIEEELKRRLEGQESGSLDGFDISEYDVSTDKKTYNGSEGTKMNWDGPGSTSHIEVTMKFKNSDRIIKTTIIDGERPKDADTYNNIYPGWRERPLSSAEYDKLIPLVREYIKLLRENQQKKAA